MKVLDHKLPWKLLVNLRLPSKKEDLPLQVTALKLLTALLQLSLQEDHMLRKMECQFLLDLLIILLLAALLILWVSVQLLLFLNFWKEINLKLMTLTSFNWMKLLPVRLLIVWINLKSHQINLILKAEPLPLATHLDAQDLDKSQLFCLNWEELVQREELFRCA